MLVTLNEEEALQQQPLLMKRLRREEAFFGVFHRLKTISSLRSFLTTAFKPHVGRFQPNLRRGHVMELLKAEGVVNVGTKHGRICHVVFNETFLLQENKNPLGLNVFLVDLQVACRGCLCLVLVSFGSDTGSIRQPVKAIVIVGINQLMVVFRYGLIAFASLRPNRTI